MTQINEEKVFSLVDELGNMASPKKGLSAPELAIELESAKEKKETLQIELDELLAIPGEVYVETQTELQDQAYSVTLKKENNFAKKTLTTLEKKLKELQKSEEISYTNLEQAKNSLSTSETKLSALEERKAKTNDESVKAQIESSISQTNEDIVSRKSEVESLTVEYKDIQDKILSVVTEIDEIKADISKKQEIIDGIEKKLSDDSNYINKRKKSEDDAKKESLKVEIDKIEKSIAEILSEPAMLVEQAKDAIIGNDITTAINKIKALEEIASSLPYMNETNGDSLSDAKISAESERETLKEQINGNDYEVKNNALLEARISYLRNRISLLNDEKLSIQAEVEKLDNDEKYGVKHEISAANDSIVTTKNEIAQYEELLDSTEKASDRVKIKAAYERKIKDLKIAEDLKNKYDQEEIEAIKEASKFADSVAKIDEEIHSYEQEIKEIENTIALQSTYTKDMLAEMNDNSMLKEKAATVMSIIHRNKFSTTPKEIYRQIEEELGAVLTPIAEEIPAVIEEISNVEMEEQIIGEVQPEETPAEVIDEVQEVVVPVIEETPVDLVIDPVEPQEEVQIIPEEDAIEYKPAFDIIDSIDVVEDTATIDKVTTPENITEVKDEIVIAEVKEPIEDTIDLGNTMISPEDIKSILEEEMEKSVTEESITVEPEIMKVTDEESVVVETPEHTDYKTDILDVSQLFNTEQFDKDFTDKVLTDSNVETEVPQVQPEETVVSDEVSQDNMMDTTNILAFMDMFNATQQEAVEEPTLGLGRAV